MILPGPFPACPVAVPKLLNKCRNLSYIASPACALARPEQQYSSRHGYQQQQTRGFVARHAVLTCPQLIHRGLTFLAPAAQTRQVLRSPARLLTVLSPFGRLLRLLCTFTASRPVPGPARNKVRFRFPTVPWSAGPQEYQSSHGTDCISLRNPQVMAINAVATNKGLQ